jgi:hypothetical protein
MSAETTFLYAVRCNFTVPARESDWHAWYDGPKLDEMLSLPHFISMQRYAAAALDGRRKYIALWRVASPAAFETPEYLAQWGFAQWQPFITDWSRDLYRGPPELDAAVEVGNDEALYFASFSGESESSARAGAARVALRRPGVIWIEAVGLDRDSPVVGLAKRDPAFRPPPIEDMVPGFSETLFTPLRPRRHA